MKQESVSLKFIEALAIHQEERFTLLPADYELENHVFSPKFEKKMQSLIKAQKKPYFGMINTVRKRVAVIVLALLIALSTTVFSVEALRDPFISFIIETYEKFSKVIFKNDSAETPVIKVEQWFMPEYIPDGYSLCSENRGVLGGEYLYLDADGNDLTYNQGILFSTGVRIDTEETTTQTVYINGRPGIFFSNKGYNNVMWDDGDYIFSISVISDIDQDELIAIAESVK